MSDKKAQKKDQTTQKAATPAADPKTAKKKKAAPAAAAPAEEEWTLVTNRRRNGKKNPEGKRNKKNEEQEQYPQRQEGARGGHRDFRRRPHAADEIIPIEHTKDVAKVVLFVTNEVEEAALKKELEGRPYEIVAVATMEGQAKFESPEALAKVRVVAGVEAVRALMKELGVALFVMPVDNDLLPGPRMKDEVSAMLDVAVRAGAYVLTVSITPIVAKESDQRTFFAAVPTHESQQVLVNTLGVVEDETTRQDFEMNGFDVPEEPGLFDIWTSLMNSAVKKFKACGEAEILPNGDQFVQDVASQTKKAVHYPVFTVSFRVGKLEHYTSHQSNRVIYEIYSDEIVPDSLKNIFILLGVSIHQKLTIIVSKYQGQVKAPTEDPEKKVDVEFEKIIYSYSSVTETPIFELYLPRYVDPTATPVAAEPAPAAAAAAPEAEAAAK